PRSSPPPPTGCASSGCTAKRSRSRRGPPGCSTSARAACCCPTRLPSPRRGWPRSPSRSPPARRVRSWALVDGPACPRAPPSTGPGAPPATPTTDAACAVEERARSPAVLPGLTLVAAGILDHGGVLLAEDHHRPLEVVRRPPRVTVGGEPHPGGVHRVGEGLRRLGAGEVDGVRAVEGVEDEGD